MFVSTRVVVIVATGCMAIAVAGLVISAATSSGNVTMIFGIAAMAIPIAGAVATVGSLLGNAVRSALAKGEK